MSNGPTSSSSPRGDDEDMDRRFAEIVAALRAEGGPLPRTDRPGTPETETTGTDAPGTGSSHTEPAPEAPAPPEAPASPPAAPPAAPAPAAPPREGVGEAGWREWEEPEGTEDHFVPEPPPPLPAGDLHFWGIVVGLVLGPLLLVLANVVPVLRGEIWTWLGIGLSVAGFALLVLRLPTHRDGDWGAQV